MQQEIRFATFNVFNLAPPGVKLYDNLLPSTPEEYEAKIDWTARQIDLLDADVIGFQEIFSQARSGRRWPGPTITATRSTSASTPIPAPSA
jgi:predicted extracellular nuclease